MFNTYGIKSYEKGVASSGMLDYNYYRYLIGINFNISARSLHAFLHFWSCCPDNKTNNISWSRSRSSSSDFLAKG